MQDYIELVCDIIWLDHFKSMRFENILGSQDLVLVDMFSLTMAIEKPMLSNFNWTICSRIEARESTLGALETIRGSCQVWDYYVVEPE